MIDESTEFGARVARHLREETVVWLTTVTPSGAPLPRPVGFLWDGRETVSVCSQPGARIRNVARNPKVTLNFRGDANGGDIVVLSGTAEVDASRPSAAENAAWVAKYTAEWERVGMTGSPSRSASARGAGCSPACVGRRAPPTLVVVSVSRADPAAVVARESHDANSLWSCAKRAVKRACDLLA